MIDSHAHIISEFYENIDDVVNEIKEKKIKCLLNCADNINSSKEVLSLSKKYSNYLFPAIGIHPENVEDYKKIDELEELIIKNDINAIGEIGLDYHYNSDNKELQKELFSKQLDLAKKYKLPVVIHSREAIQDTYDICKSKNVKGVIHCFSGSYEMAKEFIKLGYKIGIGGVVTFKNSKLFQVVEKLGIEDLLIETDSPFLAPEPFRGTKNIPSNVYYVAAKIADIKKISIDEVISITARNAINLFDFNIK